MDIKSPVSVFLVDDDRMFLSSLQRSLDSEFKKELDLSVFTNGEECLKHINGKPDIVILDYFLAEEAQRGAMNGMDVLKEIKKEADRDILVVMLSGQDKLQIAVDAIKNGAYDYVPKSESAFVRIKTIVKNATKGLVAERVSKSYVKWNLVLAIVISLMVLIDICYYFTVSH